MRATKSWIIVAYHLARERIKIHDKWPGIKEKRKNDDRNRRTNPIIAA